MNTKELKVAMIRKDMTVDRLCNAIGISRSAWFRKVSGESEFTQGEINTMRHELDLDDEQTISIFFADEIA